MAKDDTGKIADQIIREHFGGDEEPPRGLEAAIEGALDDAMSDAVNDVLGDIDHAIDLARQNY